jgi:adenylate cyclase
MQAAFVVRRVRLASGLVLFAYLATHFLNHALGLASLADMEWGRRWFLLLWRNPPGTLILYGALFVHVMLAWWALYRRRTLRMPVWEAVQLVLGLLVPPLLIIHVLGTRLGLELYGTDDTYAYVVLVQWVFQPWTGARQIAVLLIAWGHGCVGLHFWLRLRPWYAAWAPYLYSLVLVLPVTAVLGFVAAGREVANLFQDEAWFASLQVEVNFPSPEAVAEIYRYEALFLWGYAAILVGVLAARLARALVLRRRAVVIVYPGGREVVVPPGTTILDASRMAGIPHASVCGGRGRCSTCRVRVTANLESLPLASAEEMKVLTRVGAAPNVRLACQTRPTSRVVIEPLLPATASPKDARPRPGYVQGHEEEIAIMFADLRAFTKLSESKLPYDVVFLLNRYFRAMGTAIEGSGGHLDKFIGDGVMALFGLGGKTNEGCRNALLAARRMSENLEELNRALAHDLDSPLRIGVGINVGPAIVGEMGFGRATTITAIGDSVNAASRLEALCKDYACQLIVAEDVALKAGIDLGAFARHETEIRGRKERVAIRVVPDARELPVEAGR